MCGLIVKFYISIIFLFTTITSFAQSFVATASPKVVGKNEYVTLRYVVENLDATSFSAPRFTDFDVVSGPNQENGMSSVNGAVTRFVAVSFILRPKRIGGITIPPAMVAVNGKKIKSNPITIEVKNAAVQKPNIPSPQYPSNPLSSFDDAMPRQQKIDMSDFILKKGEDVAKKVENNLIIKINTSKDEVYVGEPVLASYEFYSRLRGDSKITKNPSFNNFSVIDMTTEDGGVDAVVNGKSYTKHILRRVQLYPQLPGEIPLETVSVENDIIFFTEEAASRYSINDLNSGFGVDPDAIVTQHVVLSSKAKSIRVKPLPEKGKPLSFHGAVGRYQITSSVEKESFSTDEAGVLKVTITGSGNLQLITAPEIKWPENLDAFDPELTEMINTEVTPISGSKTFTYSFSVNKAGNYEIPEILFSYFNPESISYTTDKSPAIKITVAQGVKPVKTIVQAGKNEPSFPVWYFVAGTAIVLSILAGIFRFRKKKILQSALAKDAGQVATSTAESELFIDEFLPVSIHPLLSSAACLAGVQQDRFYSTINKELRSFLSAHFNLSGNEILLPVLQQRCENLNLNNGLYLSLQALLQKIELNLYSPMHTTGEMQQIYNETAEIIEQIKYNCSQVKPADFPNQ